MTRADLSDCVPFMVTDADGVVITSQGQKTLGTPAPTSDLFSMFPCWSQNTII